MASKFALPIDRYLEKIVAGLQQSSNLILMAPPGSGKTLRAPAALLKDLIARQSKKKIIVLVPKRIAAVSAATFTAEENAWTVDQVGYQVRFDNKTNDKTQLIFMTEGVFVKKMNDPQLWNSIELIIFDEFHERSSLNDIAFGLCYERQMLELNLKIMVMSATLDIAPLQKYLGQTELIEIEAAPYPLEVIKNKKGQRLNFDFNFADQIVETVKAAFNKSKKDILVFLPGLYEIRMVQNKLGTPVPIEILHGSIKLEEQKRILRPANGRRIILSTNVAESSLTLPSVDCVVDSGLEKRAVVESKVGFKRLELTRISLFSARQRAGRAARVGPGTCYQMWHDIDERSMNEQIEPEIVKSDLLEEALILLSQDVTQPDQFSWLTLPGRSFKSVIDKLQRWDLVNRDRKITKLGYQVQRCPLDIERSVLFINLCELGFKAEASRFLAYLETNDFSKDTHPLNLDQIFLTDMGQKIERQLSQFPSKAKSGSLDFKSALLQIYLKYFPEKMAQIKSGSNGLSSNGRGLEFAPHLLAKGLEYYLLFQGRDISDSLTKIEFAIGYTPAEFEKFGAQNQTTETRYEIDFEKKNIYKIEKRLAGLFVLSESSRIPLNMTKDADAFKKLFSTEFKQFLHAHPAWNSYVTKVNFLKRKTHELKLDVSDFSFIEKLEDEARESLESTITSLAEFLDYDLYQLLLFLTPDAIKGFLGQLPREFVLPNKKTVAINYEAELAPLISVRLQELLGQFKTPTLFGGKLNITVELLAPNYRPTQITGNLEQFWKTSYQDVRKDLRARYPKHDWPENPLDWKPEMSKRLQKKT